MGGVVFVWLIVFLFLISGEGIWIPFAMLILAVGVFFLQKWLSFKWEEYKQKKRCEILEKRRERNGDNLDVKYTFKDMCQDLLYGIKHPWE